MFTGFPDARIVGGVFGVPQSHGGAGQEEAPRMDTMLILQVLFGSVISVTTALAFMEIRRLRKKLSS